MINWVDRRLFLKQLRDGFDEMQPDRCRFGVPLDRKFFGPLTGLSGRVISEAFDELFRGAQIIVFSYDFPDRKFNPYSRPSVETHGPRSTYRAIKGAMISRDFTERSTRLNQAADGVIDMDQVILRLKRGGLAGGKLRLGRAGVADCQEAVVAI